MGRRKGRVRLTRASLRQFRRFYVAHEARREIGRTFSPVERFDLLGWTVYKPCNNRHRGIQSFLVSPVIASSPIPPDLSSPERKNRVPTVSLFSSQYARDIVFGQLRHHLPPIYFSGPSRSPYDPPWVSYSRGTRSQIDQNFSPSRIFPAENTDSLERRLSYGS